MQMWLKLWLEPSIWKIDPLINVKYCCTASISLRNQVCKFILIGWNIRNQDYHSCILISNKELTINSQTRDSFCRLSLTLHSKVCCIQLSIKIISIIFWNRLMQVLQVRHLSSVTGALMKLQKLIHLRLSMRGWSFWGMQSLIWLLLNISMKNMGLRMKVY